MATRVAANEFFYTRFFAIGIFRLLELTDTRDPKALEGVVKVSFFPPVLCVPYVLDPRQMTGCRQCGSWTQAQQLVSFLVML